MVAHIAALLFALIYSLLSVPPMVLPPVAARVERLWAEEALERFLAGVDPLMNKKV